MPSARRHEGYLFVDNRNSPGVSEEFIRSTGRVAPIVPEGQVYESATKTCKHCGVVVILNPMRTRPRGYCRKCDDYVCDAPACNFDCVPLTRVLDEAQEQAFRAENGMTLKAKVAQILKPRWPLVRGA